MDAINRSAIVAVTDRQGRIIEVNDNFCRISGYERYELIGNTHQILRSGLHHKSFFCRYVANDLIGESLERRVQIEERMARSILCIQSSLRFGIRVVRFIDSLRSDLT